MLRLPLTWSFQRRSGSISHCARLADRYAKRGNRSEGRTKISGTHRHMVDVARHAKQSRAEIW